MISGSILHVPLKVDCLVCCVMCNCPWRLGSHNFPVLVPLVPNAVAQVPRWCLGVTFDMISLAADNISFLLFWFLANFNTDCLSENFTSIYVFCLILAIQNGLVA